MYPTDGRKRPHKSTSRCHSIDGTESCRGYLRQSAILRAVKREAVDRYEGLVCAMVSLDTATYLVRMTVNVEVATLRT
jgi:hypothetical protein